MSSSDQGSATVEEGAVEFGHDSVFGERRVKPTSVTGLPQRCDQPLSDAEGEAMTPEDVVDEATFERALDTIGGLGQQIVPHPSGAQAVAPPGPPWPQPVAAGSLAAASLIGDPYLLRTIAGREYRFSPGVAYPANPAAAARLAWVALGSFISISVLVAWGAVLLAELAVPLPEARTSFLLRWGCIALVVGLLALLTYRNYWNARQLAVRTKQLELESLRARIRPHFLFNTLNTAVTLVRVDPARAAAVLGDLSLIHISEPPRPHQISFAVFCLKKKKNKTTISHPR